jgi:hypothetical protein
MLFIQLYEHFTILYFFVVLSPFWSKVVDRAPVDHRYKAVSRGHLRSLSCLGIIGRRKDDLSRIGNVYGQWYTQEVYMEGGGQQIQLRTEDRENGDLGALAP